MACLKAEKKNPAQKASAELVELLLEPEEELRQKGGGGRASRRDVPEALFIIRTAVVRGRPSSEAGT